MVCRPVDYVLSVNNTYSVYNVWVLNVTGRVAGYGPITYLKCIPFLKTSTSKSLTSLRVTLSMMVSRLCDHFTPGVDLWKKEQQNTSKVVSTHIKMMHISDPKFIAFICPLSMALSNNKA